MRKLYLFLVVICCINSVRAQSIGNCGTLNLHKSIQTLDPSAQSRTTNLEQFTDQWVTASKSTTTEAIATIPVVVHVVYNTSTQNISDARIQSQINALNRDFRKLNADVSQVPAAFRSLAADINFEFCLASKDPQGVSTNGITRTMTSRTSPWVPFENSPNFTDDPVKRSSMNGKDAWPTDRYLNIWVCNLNIVENTAYSTFPGDFLPSTGLDGIVVDYRAFGVAQALPGKNLGRVTVHEVGHYFNLYHVFDDLGTGSQCKGSDYVNDTPNQSVSTKGCPSFPKMDVCTPSDNGIMFMNYMDYTYDECRMMFTMGQKQRMIAALYSAYRSELLKSDGCGTVPPCATGTPLPFTEGFESPVFPPDDWYRINYDEQYTWARTANVKKSGSASAYMENFNYMVNNATDELILPPLDLTGNSSATMSFELAYTTYNPPDSMTSDVLQVMVSTDCGATFKSVYNKSNQALRTAPNTENEFKPTASQWRKETIDLTPYTQNDHLLIKFNHVCNWENNLYLDDINISGTPATGLEASEVNTSLSISPNPGTGVFFVNTGHVGDYATLRVLNSIGQLVVSVDISQVNNETMILDLSGNPDGVYLIRIDSPSARQSFHKIILAN